MDSVSKAVFLSYASEDVEIAALVASELTKARIEVWFDRSELQGGDAWDRRIRDQIRDCALFIPIISTASGGRLEGYFRREWKLAVERTHDMADGVSFLVPLLLKGVQQRHALVPDAFRNVQWISWDDEIPGTLVVRISQLLHPRDRLDNQIPALGNEPQQPLYTPRRSPNRYTRRGICIGIAVVIIAGTTILVLRSNRLPLYDVSHNLLTPPSIASNKSIAVLPFVDMSEAKDKEYFSDGLSEELIDHLAHSPDLRVISRTSSFQFKGKNDDVRLIGERLGVNTLLEGSVRAAGQTLRITVQLIRVSDGSHLWSHTYNRTLNDLFAVQDEIAGTVVRALQATLTGHAPSPGDNTSIPAAHDLMLKGTFFYMRAHPGDLQRAIEQFKGALALDPEYAIAWVRLARAYIWENSSPEANATQLEQNARDALQRALAIDPNFPAAHRWMARLYMNFRWDWAAATQEFEKTIELDPDSAEARDARGDLASLQGFISGNFEEAIRLGQQDMVVDPLDTSAWYFLCWTQRQGRHFSASAQACRRLLDLDAEFADGAAQAALTALAMNDTALAMSLAKKEVDDESREQALALIYWKVGQQEASDEALHKLEASFAKLNPFDIGLVYAYRGQFDQAFKWLENSYTARDGGLIFLRVELLLDSARSDPRYAALLSKMKMAN